MRRSRRALDGLEQDIRDHIERETEELVARGLPPDEARRQAHLKFGSVARVREDTRAVWVWAWLEQVRQDLGYAVRSYGRTPVFNGRGVIRRDAGRPRHFRGEPVCCSSRWLSWRHSLRRGAPVASILLWPFAWSSRLTAWHWSS